MFEIRFRHHERPFALGHLLTTDRQKAMNVDFGWQGIACGFQHAGPEQGVEVCDVFADEVVNFGIFTSPPVVERFSLPITPLFRRRHVPDRSIEPDVPVVTRAVGNLKSKVGSRSRDIPVAQGLVEKVTFQIIGHFRLQMVSRLRPLVEKPMQLIQLDEQMLGTA